MRHTKLLFILTSLFLLFSCNKSTTGRDIFQYQGTGEVIEYHANGKVKSKSVFVQGQLTSTVTFFTSGTKDCEQTFRDHQLHSETCYFTSGDVKRTIAPSGANEE